MVMRIPFIEQTQYKCSRCNTEFKGSGRGTVLHVSNFLHSVKAWTALYKTGLDVSTKSTQQQAAWIV